MITEGTNSPIELLDNLPDKGPPPKSRLSDAVKARELVGYLIQAHRSRWMQNAKIKGMFDGNRPYDPAKLRSLAQAHRTNVNFLEGKAALSAASVPYYDLFAGAKFYAMVECDYGDANDRTKWSLIVTEEFDRLLKSYKAFDFRMQSTIHNLVGYGKGFLLWEDRWNWQSRNIQHQNVLVPDAEDAYVGELEVCVVRQQYRIHQLYNKIKDEKTATTAGWNVSATKEAIRTAKPKRNSTEYDDYMSIQQALKDHDLVEGNQAPTIQASHVFVKEFDGKVSHHIVLEKGGVKEYLFSHVSRYADMHQVIAAFFLEVGDGSWNGITGIGKDLYAPIEIKNRLKCSMLDGAFLRAGINIQPIGSENMTKVGLIQNGPLNILPPGCTIQQNQIMGDIEGVMKVDLALDNMLNANTGIYKQRIQKVEGNPITAEQARIDQMNQTVLSNSAVTRFQGFLDMYYSETYRRASSPELKALASANQWAKDAIDFQKRCVDRGVPKEALGKVRGVAAYRLVGNGSQFLRKEGMSQLAGLLPMLPESGRANFIQDKIAMEAGPSMVDRYYPDLEKQKLPNEHQAWAMLEDAAIKIGAPVVWTPEQNNVIHLQTHLQAGTQAAQTLQTPGVKLPDVLAFLDGVGTHCAIHLKQLAQDPTRKDIHKMLEAQFKQLAGVADKIRMQIKVQMDKQARTREEMQNATDRASNIQAGIDPAMVIKAAQMKEDARLQQAKTQHAMGLQDAKAKQKMAINDVTAAQKLAINSQEANAREAQAKAKAKPKPKSK